MSKTLVNWLREGRKRGLSFNYLKDQLLKKRNAKSSVGEAIEYVKNEERSHRRWVFFIWGLIPIVVIAFTLFFVFPQEKTIEQTLPESESSGVGISDEVKEPVPAPKLETPDQEVVVTPTPSSGGGSSGGGGGGSGGGGGGSSPTTPAPTTTPSPEPSQSIPQINETNSTMPLTNYTNSTIPTNETIIPEEPVNETGDMPEEDVQPEEPKRPVDLCEGVECEDYCIETTNYVAEGCSGGACVYSIEEKSEECGYGEPGEEVIDTTKPSSYGFNAFLEGVFIVFENGDNETLFIVKNSTGVVIGEDLHQDIVSYAKFMNNGDSATGKSKSYFVGNIAYQQIMLGAIDQWIKITPETDKSLLAKLGIKPNYFKEQSGLEKQLELIEETSFLPVDEEVCNSILLAKNKPRNKFTEIVSKMIIWPISRLKYRLGIGYAVKENLEKPEVCRIKVVADPKVEERMAGDIFDEIANSSEEMAKFVKYKEFSFAYKKALKNFELEYVIDDQARIVEVIMDSQFDFEEKHLEKRRKEKSIELTGDASKNKNKEKGKVDDEELIEEPEIIEKPEELKGKKKGMPFRTKAKLKIILRFYDYGMQGPIVLPEEVKNAVEIGEFLKAIK